MVEVITATGYFFELLPVSSSTVARARNKTLNFSRKWKSKVGVGLPELNFVKQSEGSDIATQLQGAMLNSRNAISVVKAISFTKRDCSASMDSRCVSDALYIAILEATSKHHTVV